MKTILAATDYTDLAENAVHYAASIARRYDYQLILLNDFTISIHVTNARLSAEAVEELTDETGFFWNRRLYYLQMNTELK